MEIEINQKSSPGFFIRLSAGLIDLSIICILSAIFLYAYFKVLNINFPTQKWNFFDHIVDIVIYHSEIMIPFIIIPVLIFLFYFVVIEVIVSSTPGKLIFSLKVLTDQEQNISVFHALTRNIFKFITSVIGQAGLLSILVNDRKKSLYDIISRTKVVYRRTQK